MCSSFHYEGKTIVNARLGEVKIVMTEKYPAGCMFYKVVVWAECVRLECTSYKQNIKGIRIIRL